jgi:hypothetical protein
VQKRQVAAAVSARVLELAANVADRLSLPGHLNGGQSPPWMPRDAAIGRALLQGKVMVRVACAAGISGHAITILSARNRRHMGVQIIGLCGPIARRMAVKAARARADSDQTRS